MKNRSIRARRFAPVLSLLSLTMAVSAQSQVAEITPVVVSATRVEQKISDVIPSATVITREDIERSQAPTLVDLIQGQPGVEIGRNGGPGTVSSIFMRGQSSSNVAVYIDGIPVQRDSLGGLKIGNIPPGQIEKVEILRGNMAAIYGESAVGGVINIYTRSDVASSGPSGSASYGSRNTSDVVAGYNVRGDDFKLGLSLQRFDTDGYSAMNSSQNSSINPDNDGFKRESIFINGEKKVNKDLAFGLQANSVGSDVDYDNTGGATKTHSSKQKSDDLTLYSRFSPSTEWSSRVALTQSKFENREFVNGAENIVFDGKQLSMQWGNVYKLGSGNVSFGVDAADAEFKNYGSYKRDSRGYYAGYRGQLESFDYQVNLRRDEVKDKSNASDLDESVNTWLLGAGYLVSENTKLTGLVSTSFRAPSVSEFGNTPSLNAEEHKGYELGISHTTGIGTLKLVHFDTETTNAISYTGIWPCSSNCYENIDKFENKGIDLSFAGASAGWGYKFSAVTQDPKNAETGARLTRRAKEYGSVDLSKNAIGIDWGAKIVWSGNRADVGDKSLPSYTVVNLTASKKLSPELTCRLKVENAFDKKYQLAYGYDTPPRGFFVSLQYQPK